MNKDDFSQLFLSALGQYNPERLHLILDEEKPENGILSQEKDIVYIHEKFHHIQTLMTNFGQIRWRMNRQATMDILESWIQVTNKYAERRPLPLGYLASKESVEDIRNAFTVDLNRIGLLLLGMQNYVSPTMNKMSDTGYIKLDYEIVPTINVFGKAYKLNGIDIIESHAKFIEATYALTTYNIHFDVTYDSRKLPERYYFAYAYFIEVMGLHRVGEFPIICNLALQTDYIDGSFSETKWKSNHPAWRFIALIDALKDNVVPEMDSIRLIKRNYLDYCNKLLNICGYKTMDDILELPLLQFDDNQKLNLEQQMNTAIEYRKRFPWCVANPFLDYKVWEYLKSHFHAPLMQYGKTLHFNFINGGDVYTPNTPISNELSEYFIEIHIQALANQIIGEISPYSQDSSEIQCGFAYLGIERGCYYQSTGECNGSLNPKNGYKVDWKFTDKENVSGCMFAMFLDECINVNIKNIDLNFYKKFPRVEDLVDRARVLSEK